jgi:hypothetical protein
MGDQDSLRYFFIGTNYTRRIQQGSRTGPSENNLERLAVTCTYVLVDCIASLVILVGFCCLEWSYMTMFRTLAIWYQFTA